MKNKLNAKLKLKKTAWILTVAIIISLTLGCKRQSDPDQIVQLIDNAVILAEKHDVKKLFKLTTDDFVSKPGSRDGRASKLILLMAFRRYQSFSIRYPTPIIDVAPNGKTATVNLPFAIIRDNKPMPDVQALIDDPDQWIKKMAEKADPYYLDLKLIKEGGDWKVKIATLSGIRNVHSI